MNIKPQGLKLIVRQFAKKDEELESGIIISEVANADLRDNEVLSVSKELEGIIQIGDIVLSPNRKGVTQRIDGEWLLWLDATPEKEEIWGVITKEDYNKK